MTKDLRGTVPFPVFAYDVHVVITDDIDKAYEHFQDIIGQPIIGGLKAGLHSSSANYPGQSWIFLDRKGIKPGLIVHESAHAVHAMLDYIGVVDFDSEIVAYHLEYLVDKIVQLYKRGSK